MKMSLLNNYFCSAHKSGRWRAKEVGDCTPGWQPYKKAERTPGMIREVVADC